MNMNNDELINVILDIYNAQVIKKQVVLVSTMQGIFVNYQDSEFFDDLIRDH